MEDWITVLFVMIRLIELFNQITQDLFVNANYHIMRSKLQNVQVFNILMIKACSSYCLGCVDTPDNCTSCNSQQYRSLDGNKCKCAVRFGTQNLSYYENMQDPECIGINKTYLSLSLFMLYMLWRIIQLMSNVQ